MGEGMEYKAKRKVVNFGNKNLMGAVSKSNDSRRGVLPFLDEAAPIIEKKFPEYTGSVTLHIRDGKLASWESKAGGRYKD